MTRASEQNPLFAPTAEGLLHVGARDWDHPGWRGGFYPPDLPREWRLGYYANEFSAVLVPAERWLGVEAEGLEGWADEVHGAFRFVLEGGGVPAQRRCAEGALGERFGGWLETGGEWRPGRADGTSRAGLLPPGPHPPRALRGMLESFVAQAPDGERFLFLEGTPPDTGTLRAVVTLRDLMGL